jgi:hypothetical protein
MQPHQTQKFIKIAVNRGTRPDYETRINYPQLFNMFVGGSGYSYTDPGLSKLSPDAPDEGARAVHYSSYNGGRFFTVTQTQVIEESFDGTGYRIIATINNSGQPVQISENAQHQVIFVDGEKAYVYSQQATPPTFVTLSDDQEFTLNSPISVKVVNNIGAVLDAQTNSWIVSGANDLLLWPPLQFNSVDSTLTKAVSLETVDNNLFIFGTTGIERWVPNTGNSPYIFPFDKDTSYRQSVGAISTNAIANGFGENGDYNVLYFLSSKFVPMSLSSIGLKEVPTEDYKAGLARILSSYEDATKCEASFYIFKGNYTFAMTFVETGICWRYCVNSDTLSTGDDLIVSSVDASPVVATPDGIFTLVQQPQMRKRRTWIGDNMQPYKGQQPSRSTMCALDVQILQGLAHQGKEELELSFSLDGQQTWTNTVNRPIGATGQRNAQTTWVMNIAAKQFTPRVSYYGNLEFTIREVNATFK